MDLIEIRSSESMDPLQHFSLLSMFHRTFKDPPIAKDSDNPNSIHSFLNTMESRNTNKLFGKAKDIVQGSSELLGTKLAPLGAYENNDEAVTTCDVNPQERRPALGRKRAKFSLKPDKGLPSVSLEQSLDIDQLQDPEEFFLAYHKLEYAKEEIERQTGGNMTEKNEYNPSANQRRRRPGIFGKSVSYKHNYSSAILEDDDTVIASQETSQQHNLSPSKFVSHEPSNSNVELQERELAGSVSNSENTAGWLLDDLLSRDIKNLDGDGALSLLQASLQIKPVDLDKYLHDFSEVGKVDLMDLEEEMPVSLKVPSDIQNAMNGLSEKSPVNYKQVAENQNHSLTFSIPPKRPSAASSLLERGNSLSKPFHFSFSAADLDLSPAGSPTREYFDGQSDNLCTRNELRIPGKLKSRVDDEAKNPACATLGSKQVIPGINCLETSASFNTSSIDIDRTKESHDGLVDTNEGNHVGDILHEAVSSVQPDFGNGDLSSGCSDTVFHAHGLSESEKNVEEIQPRVSSPEPDVDIDDSTLENLKISQSQLGHQEPIVAEGHFINGHTTYEESRLEQQNEEHPKISLKDRSKAGRARGLKERKALSRRQSLAAAGTCWNSGVRRSKRIRMRPLEYWKGERFVYGRVHESLTTVIGVKCISSPSPGGKESRFRVTSYVSDEHKELVESAALH